MGELNSLDARHRPASGAKPARVLRQAPCERRSPRLQLDLQLQITQNTVKTQIDSVKLANLCLAHGVATKMDVLQAQQVLDTANAQIPDLERQIAQEEDAISIRSTITRRM
jgi:hypothetical protein